MSYSAEGPAITEYVLENLPDYNEENKEGGYLLLNADTVAESDNLFAQLLVEMLPELSDMTEVNPLIPGTSVEVYSVQVGEREFYVKHFPEYRNVNTKLAFQRYMAEFNLAKGYFTDYMPLTIFIEWDSANKKKKEYLILQEKVEGYQYKYLKKNLESMPNISEVLKEKLGDFLRCCAAFYITEGKHIEFDFILDVVNEDVAMFDFSLQEGQHIHVFQCLIAANLYDWFGVKVPIELQIPNWDYS